jgi:mycothiol system anti-sigma-R factor
MKSCDEYAANIQLYLDKELSGQELEEFRAHLTTCVSCREELAAEEELSSVLYRSRPLYSASDALRDRVRQATIGITPSGKGAPGDLRNNILGMLRQPADYSGRRWQALAAMVLVIGLGLAFVPGIVQRVRASSYVDMAIATHRSFVEGSLPLEVQSDSPTAVAAWFTGKVPFKFRLPSSGETTGQDGSYKLIGGRLVSYQNGYAALVAYRMKQQTISLLITSDKFAGAAGGEVVRSGGITFHHNRRASLNIITWSNHGLTYALVSSLPGSGKQSCLVCHENMVDSRQFAARR